MLQDDRLFAPPQPHLVDPGCAQQRDHRRFRRLAALDGDAGEGGIERFGRIEVGDGQLDAEQAMGAHVR